MTYKELLLAPEWRLKRKEILTRDNLTCSNCKNANLIKGCLIGLLSFRNKNHDGKFFNFHGLNSSDTLIHKVFFLKNESLIIPFYSTSNKSESHELNPIAELIAAYNYSNNLKKGISKIVSDDAPNIDKHIAYLYTEFDDLKFAKIIAIRDRQPSDINELPVNFNNEEFKRITYKLKDHISDQYKWKVVPGLHVHHTYYQLNLNPWEYPNNSLQTLCWVCHETLHKDQTVPFFDQNGREVSTLTPCGRCFGAGEFPQWKHIDEGVCFQCNGAKYLELIKTPH